MSAVDLCIGRHAVVPDWPAPDNIIAFTTTRLGGVSEAPYSSWNLAHHVGDEKAHVDENRQQLQQLLPTGSRLNWLEQVHGTVIVDAPSKVQESDGVFTDKLLQACCIMTADCLPILMCNQQGDQIAALHAGWRGVADRIIEQGFRRFSAPADELMVWIGPSITARHFRIGRDVEQKLSASIRNAECRAQFFRQDQDSKKHVFADLQGMVEQQCHELGINQVFQSNCCSFSDSDRFFSYRREQQTGRNVSVILRTH